MLFSFEYFQHIIRKILFGAQPRLGVYQVQNCENFAGHAQESRYFEYTALCQGWSTTRCGKKAFRGKR